ncbi:MAG: BTAD domain-containing putative transcriptional regulator [Acidimicrobiia bacterium]
MEEAQRLGPTRSTDLRLTRTLEDIGAAVEAEDYSSALQQIDESAEFFVEWGFDVSLDRLEGWLRKLEAHDPDNPWVLYYLAWVWSTQRRHSLALVTLRRARQRFAALLDPGSEELRRARFLCAMAAGITHEREGLFEAARGSFDQALELGGFGGGKGELSEDERRWRAHDRSGMFSFWLAAVHLYEEMGLIASLARAYHNLGTKLVDRGEPVPGRRFLEMAAELKLGAGNQLSLGNTLNSLAHAERHLGLTERASTHLQQVLDLAERLGHDTLRSYGLNNLAELRRDEGRFETAFALYRQSLEIKERMENTFGLAYTYASQADAFLFAGQSSRARASADQAVDLRVPGPDPVENVRLLSAQARARLADGEDPARLGEKLDELIEELTAFDVKGELAVAHWWRAASLLRLGDLRSAEDSAARALELASAYRLEHLLVWHVALHPDVLAVALADPEVGEAARALETLAKSQPRLGPEVAPAGGSPRLRGQLFGDLKVFMDDKEVPLWTWRSKKAVTLLGLLLHHRGDPLHREQAMESLWPEGDPERSSKNLNVALTALRRGLEQVHPRGSSVLERQGPFYRIAADALESLDVQEFLAGQVESGRRGQEGDLRGALLQAEEALDLVGGAYLASEPYAEWAVTERAHFDELVIDLRLRAAEWSLELERFAQAIEHATKALAIDRLRERAWSALVRAHGGQGDRAAGLRALEECRRVLEEELGIEPSAELTGLASGLRSSATS